MKCNQIYLLLKTKNAAYPVEYLPIYTKLKFGSLEGFKGKEGKNGSWGDLRVDPIDEQGHNPTPFHPPLPTVAAE